MEEIIAWITAEGRLPRDRSENKGERSMARWLSDRRREAAEGTLHPAYRDGLARVPGGPENHRAAADEARWHDRLAQLVDFRPKATTGHATTTTTQSGNTPSECGSTPSDTNTAAASSTPPRSGFWTRPFPAGRREDPGPPSPPVTGSGCAHWGQVEPSAQLKAVPTGVQPGLCRSSPAEYLTAAETRKRAAISLACESNICSKVVLWDPNKPRTAKAVREAGRSR